MPLVVPGITGNSNSASASSTNTGEAKQQEWLSKLAGKKLGDTHDETTFAKKDLPQEHRVLEPDSFGTTDFKKDRMNVHTDAEGRVHDVSFK